MWTVGDSLVVSYFFGAGFFGEAFYTDPIIHFAITISLNLITIMVYNIIRLFGGRKIASFSLIVGSSLGILIWLVIALFFDHLLEDGYNVVYYYSVIWGIVASSLVGLFGFCTLRKWKKPKEIYEN